MPEKDPENIKWILGLLVTLATTLWGVLTYRIWDISKVLSAKVDLSKFDETIENMRKEIKEDFRYHQEQVNESIKGLAKDLKDEIRNWKP